MAGPARLTATWSGNDRNLRDVFREFAAIAPCWRRDRVRCVDGGRCGGRARPAGATGRGGFSGDFGRLTRMGKVAASPVPGRGTDPAPGNGALPLVPIGRFSDPPHRPAPTAASCSRVDTGRMPAFHPPPPTATGFWPRLAWSLWPPRCLICAEPGLPGCDLCAACWAQWPRAGRSCLGCAMPLVGGCAHSAIDGDDPAPGSALIVAAPPQRCGACRAHASPLSEVRAACLYRAPLDRLLPRFKFHRDLAAGRLLATTMAAAFAPLAERIAAANGGGGSGDGDGGDGDALRSTLAANSPRGIGLSDTRIDSARRPCTRTERTPASCTPVELVPIPLHRARLRQRGYDQALELARPLSRRLGLPLRAIGLHRAHDTPPQSRLDAAQRRRNLRDAFAWNANAPPPTHAILIDDVMTTGATLHAAAQALRRAGAQRVDAWVCARTL